MSEAEANEASARRSRSLVVAGLSALGVLALVCTSCLLVGHSFYKRERPTREPRAARVDGERELGYRLLAEARAAQPTLANACTTRCEWLLHRLERGTPEESVALQRFLEARMAESNTPALRAACSIVLGPCSDEYFLAFRMWLLLQGRATWEEALARPDAIADYALGRPLCDGLRAIAPEAHRRLAGTEMPDPYLRADLPAGPSVPADDYRDRFPRLCRRYGCGFLDTFLF